MVLLRSGRIITSLGICALLERPWHGSFSVASADQRIARQATHGLHTDNNLISLDSTVGLCRPTCDRRHQRSRTRAGPVSTPGSSSQEEVESVATRGSRKRSARHSLMLARSAHRSRKIPGRSRWAIRSSMSGPFLRTEWSPTRQTGPSSGLSRHARRSLYGWDDILRQ
jgi:hypothetical protein